MSGKCIGLDVGLDCGDGETPDAKTNDDEDEDDDDDEDEDEEGWTRRKPVAEETVGGTSLTCASNPNSSRRVTRTSVPVLMRVFPTTVSSCGYDTRRDLCSL